MHTHGALRAIAKPLWLHCRDTWRSPEYRALHRFARQLRSTGGHRPVRFAGRTIQVGDGPSFLSAWDEIFVSGIYDVGTAGPAPRLVDAGANVGLAALYWQLHYPGFHYTGFEPDPAVAALCRANLAAWRVEGELHEAAVTGREGTVGFAADGADGGRVTPGATGGRVVRSMRLAPFLAAPVDLLKIDIEGAELEVLRDSAGRLSAVRNIFVEVHSRPDRPQALPEILAILERAGFRCHLQVGFAAPQPLRATVVSPGGFDSQVNVFGVRARPGGGI